MHSSSLTTLDARQEVLLLLQSTLARLPSCPSTSLHTAMSTSQFNDQQPLVHLSSSGARDSVPLLLGSPLNHFPMIRATHNTLMRHSSVLNAVRQSGSSQSLTSIAQRSKASKSVGADGEHASSCVP